jgi:hypothetical protein
MNRREFLTSVSAGVAVAFGQARIVAQSGRPIDLASLADRNGLALVNRTAARLVDGPRTGVRLSAGSGEGAALIPGIAVSNGTIDVDLRGKDVPQQSFLGIVFHAIDGSAMDAIYFRPFNFRSADPTSHSHAVQYHATPGFTWDKLRDEHPGQYEDAAKPVPDPNTWFHARIVLVDPEVRVYVENATIPCLVVNTLSGRKTGLVGLWVGNGSDGDFANLTITPP